MYVKAVAHIFLIKKNAVSGYFQYHNSVSMVICDGLKQYLYIAREVRLDRSSSFICQSSLERP